MSVVGTLRVLLALAGDVLRHHGPNRSRVLQVARAQVRLFVAQPRRAVPRPPAVKTGGPATSLRWVRLAGVILILLVGASAALAWRVVAPADDVGHDRAQPMAGFVWPSDVSAITLHGPGSIAAVLVGLGEEVTEGQPLVRLDIGDGARDVQQLSIDLDVAREEVTIRERAVVWSDEALVRLQSVDPGSALARAERDAQLVPMRQARDSPERAQASYEQAQVRVRHAEQLGAAGLLSKREVDDAAFAMRMAADDLRNALTAAETSERLKLAEDAQIRARHVAALDQQQQHLIASRAALQQARLTLSKVQLQYDEARQRITDTFVRAPRSGAIVELAVHAGDRLAAGAVLGRVASIDLMTVDVDVTARIVNAIRIGDMARVDIPGMNVLGLDARVRGIGPVPGDNGKFPLQLALSNPSRVRLAGQTAVVSLAPRKAPALQ